MKMRKGRQRTVQQRSLVADALIRFSRKPLPMLGLCVLLAVTILCMLAGVIAPEGYDVQNTDAIFVSPCKEYIFGTDNLGRSLFVRLLYGGQVSLFIGVAATLISGVFGTLFGALAGFYGGKIDNIIMRALDILASLPAILLAIAISATLGGGLVNAIIAVGISSIPAFARMMRGPIMAVKEQQYIEAARATDAKDSRIILRYILPNVSSQLIIQVSMYIAKSILTAASLSFLGLGVTPPQPEWGSMISAGRAYIMNQPYLVTFPGLCIAIVVLCLNLVGDGLRDAFDPRLKN